MSGQSQSPLQPMVDKLRYWAKLDTYWGEFDMTDEQAILSLPHRTQKVERHGYIVREREVTTHSCVLISGYAIRHKIVMGGARQIVAVHMRGDLLDLQNSFLGVADHSVQVLTDSLVAFIPREAVKKLGFERPNVGMAMWHDTLVDGSIFREWIANVGRRAAPARIAHFLCEFSLRLKVAGLGEETDYELPMTQEQLADCVGLTPVHVNRTLKALEADNLIARKTSLGITIGNWKKLAEAGDFDSNYLHLRRNEPALD
jgi:CRP-like cAMP-binding protein